MKGYLTAIVIPFYPIAQTKITPFHLFDTTHPWTHPCFHPFFGFLLKKTCSHEFRLEKFDLRGGTKKTGLRFHLGWMMTSMRRNKSQSLEDASSSSRWLGWDGGDGWGWKEVSSLKTSENRTAGEMGACMNGREMKWQLLNQPIHFQGRSVGFREGCMVFFVVGLMCGGWMVGISIACIFLL